MKLTDEERDAVLAGLRLLEAELYNGPLLSDLDNIYTNCGAHQGLDVREISELCERINV